MRGEHAFELAPSELHLTEISFKNLPLYSYDYDANYPVLPRYASASERH